jgi:hypothetical protein
MTSDVPIYGPRESAAFMQHVRLGPPGTYLVVTTRTQLDKLDRSDGKTILVRRPYNLSGGKGVTLQAAFFQDTDPDPETFVAVAASIPQGATK